MLSRAGFKALYLELFQDILIFNPAQPQMWSSKPKTCAACAMCRSSRSSELRIETACASLHGEGSLTVATTPTVPQQLVEVDTPSMLLLTEPITSVARPFVQRMSSCEPNCGPADKHSLTLDENNQASVLNPLAAPPPPLRPLGQRVGRQLRT